MICLPGRIGQGGGDVFRFQKSVIRQDFLARCASGDEIQDIADSDAVAANARPTTALAGLNGDTFEQLHPQILAGFRTRLN